MLTPPSTRLLLADDDAEVRCGVEDLLSPLLSPRGVQILHAETGLEVLELLRPETGRIHLMVLDMHMPGCGGLEVLASLRELALETPPACICYSGEATASIERQALDFGACAFLRKPVQPDLLRGEVLRVLERLLEDGAV